MNTYKAITSIYTKKDLQFLKIQIIKQKRFVFTAVRQNWTNYL